MATQKFVVDSPPQAQPESSALQLTKVPTRTESDAEIEFSLEQRIARVFFASGCFHDLQATSVEQGIAQAFVKIAIGKSLGLTAGESMIGLDFIHGIPSIRAHVRAAKMKALGYYWSFRRFDSKGCSLLVYDSKGRQLGESTYTEEDARLNNLLGKDNWKKNPKNMYYCRAISNAQRWYAPEALGAASVPSIEEMEDATVRHIKRAAVDITRFQPSTEENRGHDQASDMPHGPISVEQALNLYEMANQYQWSTEQFDALLKQHGFSKAEEVTKDKYDALLGELQKGDAAE